MAVKPFTLSFLSSLSPLHFPNPPSPSTFNLHSPKPFTIFCQFTIPHQNQTDPEGTGAAAPTRGDLFLERQQLLAVSETAQKDKVKKKKKVKALKVVSLAPSCYGCGAPLQMVEMDAPGYVEPEVYELKKKHHQLRRILCGRCRMLSHGHMITAVGGHGGYSGGKQFVTAEELREKLSHLRHDKALIVKLVDIVDFNGSFLARIRDLAGANPIILVVTKVDLLPKGTDFNCIGDWIVDATMRKKLNVLSVHLTSSKSLVGITGVISEVQKEKKGRDVYILVSSANVGKSAFISSLLKIMSDNDPVAAAAQKYKPIQSAVPGTTLGPIQIDAFMGGGKIYDTPGVHLHHRQAAVVHSEDLPALAPQSRLRGQPFPNSGVLLDDQMADRVKSHGLRGFSLFWGGLARIDILKAYPETRLTFYGPKALPIHMVPLEEADDFYLNNVGTLLTPPTTKDVRDNWIGLEQKREVRIEVLDSERPACDVAISGLGWISVEPFSKSLKTTEAAVEEPYKDLLLTVHVPKPVEIFVRPPMPVSKAGSEWYQYRELTEKETEVRPRWYY